jgi:hypothetical protein
MSSNILASDVGELLREALDGIEGEMYLIAPSRETVEAAIEVLGDAEGVTVGLLADERVLKDVLEDFLVGSLAADLIEAGRLELRTADLSSNTLLVNGERVHAVVEAGDRVAGVAIDDPDFVSRASDQYGAAWADAEEYNLRTPAISRVRETLSTELGADVAEDFDDVMESLETARGNGDGLDEVTVSLLVAAHNEELLYDISRWGEDVGIASKATFSRMKTRLEELGLIDTEKVPIDVGRPRLRLVLGEERLRGASPCELANATQSVLAS